MEKKLIVGQMIDYYLKEQKMTRKTLGEILGKSESAVSKWVSGANTPLAKDLAIMSELFDVDIETLMYGLPVKNNSLNHEEINTVAAHMANANKKLTKEDIENINQYIDFIISQKNSKD
ncbi:helix-turn-helix domain-containing protein [Carnobacterium gallinarum]|uniref:helix-turn-helix domain-containing protein n=1 Tax=Carnobacterium gallinarum TaxID=2749 RepID=UPI0005598588|nr:helix-turn-helix transcriptional regulator [Carnobacterium gallinarum]